jgi:hypothetical protein
MKRPQRKVRAGEHCGPVTIGKDSSVRKASVE